MKQKLRSAAAAGVFALFGGAGIVFAGASLTELISHDHLPGTVLAYAGATGVGLGLLALLPALLREVSLEQMRFDHEGSFLRAGLRGVIDTALIALAVLLIGYFVDSVADYPVKWDGYRFYAWGISASWGMSWNFYKEFSRTYRLNHELPPG